jgi:hypothetical protein
LNDPLRWRGVESFVVDSGVHVPVDPEKVSMAMYFLTGSEKDETSHTESDKKRPNNHVLRVHDILEHMTLRVDHSIHVVADFFVENTTKGKGSALYILHCGDLKPRDMTEEWLNGKPAPTRVARKVLQTHFTQFGIERNGQADVAKVTHRWGEEPHSYTIDAADNIESITVRDTLVTPNGCFIIPFSIAKTRKIEPGERCLIRVSGTVTLPNIEAFAVKAGKLRIYGEGRLISHIRTWLETFSDKTGNDQKEKCEGYLDQLDKFCKDHWQRSDRYHFIFDTSNKNLALAPVPISGDLAVGLEDCQIGSMRATWIRSIAADATDGKNPHDLSGNTGPFIMASFPDLEPSKQDSNHPSGVNPALPPEKRRVAAAAAAARGS